MLCVCYDALHTHLWSDVGQYICHTQMRALFCHVLSMTVAFVLKAYAETIQDELKKFPEDAKDDVAILFSAHSLPIKVVF